MLVWDIDSDYTFILLFYCRMIGR